VRHADIADTRRPLLTQCRSTLCGADFFPRIDPAIIVRWPSDGHHALPRRQATWPAGRYSTIAGFVEPGESLEARRGARGARGNRRDGDRQRLSLLAALALSVIADARLHGERRAGLAGKRQQRTRGCPLGFTREDIVAGKVILPPPTSISHRLIETWFDAGSKAPLRSLVKRSWNSPGGALSSRVLAADRWMRIRAIARW
jgi:NAD+ diphosphatase